MVSNRNIEMYSEMPKSRRFTHFTCLTLPGGPGNDTQPPVPVGVVSNFKNNYIDSTIGGAEAIGGSTT